MDDQHSLRQPRESGVDGRDSGAALRWQQETAPVPGEYGLRTGSTTPLALRLGVLIVGRAVPALVSLEL